MTPSPGTRRRRPRVPLQGGEAGERGDQARGRASRPEARLDPHSALALVKVISEFASPEDPESATMRAFNEGREPSGHPTAPTSEAIHQRFNLRKPKVSWREILRVACSDTSPERWLSARERATPDRSDLSDDDCSYALQVVARELDGASFPPGRYDRIRQKLIARDRRRPGGGLMKELLPTANQIDYHYDGDWASALQEAHLEPYRRSARSRRQTIGTAPRRGIPVVDAIEHFGQVNDRLPGKAILQEFCRSWDVSLAAIKRGRKYASYVEEAEDRWLARGEAPPRRAQPSDRLAAIVIPEDRPEGARSYGQRGSDEGWDPERIIEELREYVRLLGSRRGSQNDYQQEIDEHPGRGWPATSTITSHGLGFQEALAEAWDRERGQQ